ncbi:MAG TPA: hypothetical protein PLA94_11475, partial [Myxococcota bacterium]|nr:hypothetical protein [Myxococcota bacterium]
SASGKSVMGYDGALDVGDLDGDGIDDLIAGHYWRVNTATATAYQGWAYLYYGDGTRITTAVSTSTADANWTGQAVQDNFATSIRVLPDLDEDGLPELAFGAVGIDSPTTNAGNLLIWGGSATRLSGAILPSSADLKIRGASGSSLGTRVVGMEDMDGDGNSELAVSATAYTSAYSAYGGIFVYEAPLNLSAATLDYTDADYGWESNAAAILGTTLAGGDFDGDGLSDLVSQRANAGTNPYGAMIFLGE